MVIKTANILHTGIVFFFLTASVFAESNNERAVTDSIVPSPMGWTQFCADQPEDRSSAATATARYLSSLRSGSLMPASSPADAAESDRDARTDVRIHPTAWDDGSNGAFGSPLSLP